MQIFSCIIKINFTHSICQVVAFKKNIYQCKYSHLQEIHLCKYTQNFQLCLCSLHLCRSCVVHSCTHHRLLESCIIGISKLCWHNFANNRLAYKHQRIILSLNFIGTKLSRRIFKRANKDQLAYAADYRPIRIIDLGQTIYQPPPKSKCACSVDCYGAWAIVAAWTRVYAATKDSTNIGLESVHCHQQLTRIMSRKCEKVSPTFISARSLQPGAVSKLHRY